MAIGMMQFALQEQAKKSGYAFYSQDDGSYVVVNTLDERVVSIEPNIDELADLLGCICVQTEEERRIGRVADQGRIDEDDAAELVYRQIIERRKHEAEIEAREARSRFLEGEFREHLPRRGRSVPAFVARNDEHGNEVFVRNPALSFAAQSTD